jgi:replicative DNA helicase
LQTEKIILGALAIKEEFVRAVLPFIREEYFSSKPEQVVYRCIKNFVDTYNAQPTKEALVICLDDSRLNGDEHKQCVALINEVFGLDKDTDLKWLIDTAEKFCKDKAVYNAVLASIQILDGKDKNFTKNAIPQLLSDALAVSFDTAVGHDYMTDADKRYEFYHRVEEKMPFDLEFFNKITKGGVPRKTLNIVMAGTGVGKSMFMCHHAASCLSANKNVLYITCEMAEERIAERIDANLMDTALDELKDLPKETYDKRLARAVGAVRGNLIIKEYPTATATVAHFRHLLHELKIKKKFVPDIIFIDYLNICASSRVKMNANVNTYVYIKAIAEELRGLAVEYDVPIFSATQTNRGGFNNSDVGLENTSESFGLPATADFMFAVIRTEQLDSLNQVLVKQLKNRYGDENTNKKFVMGVDRGKMKFYDVEQSAQDSLVDTGQISDDDDDDEPRGYGSGYDGKSYSRKFEGKKFEKWKI